MKLVLVNIGTTVNANAIMLATQEAWKLKKSRAEQCEFVVAVARGKIEKVFKNQGVYDHPTQIGRIGFDLAFCSPSEESLVVNCINNDGVKLKYFVTKFLSIDCIL